MHNYRILGEYSSILKEYRNLKTILGSGKFPTNQTKWAGEVTAEKFPLAKDECTLGFMLKMEPIL